MNDRVLKRRCKTKKKSTGVLLERAAHEPNNQVKPTNDRGEHRHFGCFEHTMLHSRASSKEFSFGGGGGRLKVPNLGYPQILFSHWI